MKEIRIYIEGGGRSDARAAAREGWSRFLNKGLGLAVRVIPCGSRNSTFEAFNLARRNYPEAFLVLLVDSETPVTASPREHLRSQDKSWDLSKVAESSCHLMAQTMEAWLIADPDALAGFYGQGFHRGALPTHRDVEAVPKADVLRHLHRATTKCQKDPYHKTRHPPELLKRINPARVRARAKHCDRLFNTLTGIIEER